MAIGKVCIYTESPTRQDATPTCWKRVSFYPECGTGGFPKGYISGRGDKNRFSLLLFLLFLLFFFVMPSPFDFCSFRSFKALFPFHAVFITPSLLYWYFPYIPVRISILPALSVAPSSLLPFDFFNSSLPAFSSNLFPRLLVSSLLFLSAFAFLRPDSFELPFFACSQKFCLREKVPDKKDGK